LSKFKHQIFHLTVILSIISVSLARGPSILCPPKQSTFLMRASISSIYTSLTHAPFKLLLCTALTRKSLVNTGSYLRSWRWNLHCLPFDTQRGYLQGQGHCCWQPPWRWRLQWLVVTIRIILYRQLP
jgi:hypothetical protein